MKEAVKEEKLKKEIKSGRYHIVLQPKYDFMGNIRSAEALIRCKSEDGTLEIPKDIIKLEEDGIIYQVDFFVLEEVCRFLQEIPELIISLNFSRSTLMETNLLERMEQIRNKYHIDSRQVEIEITETARTKDMEVESKIVKKIKKYGYRLALDDFGVEYSNLLYLVINPFDTLKLDKSLIDEIEKNWKNRLLLKNMIETCHQMHIEIVAEGVEDEKQYQFLKQNGCDRVQGYLMDRPMSVEEFKKKYKKQQIRMKELLELKTMARG